MAEEESGFKLIMVAYREALRAAPGQLRLSLLREASRARALATKKDEAGGATTSLPSAQQMQALAALLATARCAGRVHGGDGAWNSALESELAAATAGASPDELLTLAKKLRLLALASTTGRAQRVAGVELCSFLVRCHAGRLLHPPSPEGAGPTSSAPDAAPGPHAAVSAPPALFADGRPSPDGAWLAAALEVQLLFLEGLGLGESGAPFFARTRAAKSIRALLLHWATNPTRATVLAAYRSASASHLPPILQTFLSVNTP
jgi:hypothetical protein